MNLLKEQKIYGLKEQLSIKEKPQSMVFFSLVFLVINVPKAVEQMEKKIEYYIVPIRLSDYFFQCLGGDIFTF